MPRKAFKRGSDNRSNMIPKACIMCAIERAGQSYGEVLGMGQPTTQMIDHAFGKRVVSGSLMLSDGALAMKNYFTKKEDIDLQTLKSTMTGRHIGGDPEIRGIYHIQTVNNFHNRLQRFMRKYNGVSTKYLNHYVGLFVWVENHKHLASPLESALKPHIVAEDAYITAEMLINRPPLPSVA